MTSPVPGGTIGRTDQGVDISAAPGTPVNAIAQSRVIGIIRNWYKGQPFEWFQILSGKFKGRYWYGAEQIDFSARPGDIVQEGQRVGTIARSGTGTEFGWATKSGRTRAAATTGYKEGQATAAGRDFMQQVIRGSSAQSWAPCSLTWYDPALGGTNSASGAADPHSATASGAAYNANAFTCAAPPSYPFGTKIMFRYRGKSVTCTVNDRGGAIQGAHFDLSRRAAQTLGILNAGKVNAQYSVTGGPAGAGGITRPGGAADDNAGIDALFASYITEGDNATATMQNAALFGLDKHGLPYFDPLAPFGGAVHAFNDAVGFLKLIAWLFHPRNVLRAVEFIAGLTIMGAGIHTAVQVHRHPGEQTTLGRAAGTAVQATPVGRSLRVARGARAGRTAARTESRRAEYNKARKSARTKAAGKGKTKRNERSMKQRYGGVPF